MDALQGIFLVELLRTIVDIRLIEKCNGAKMTPMAQTNTIFRGCLWSGNRQTIE